MQMHEAMASEAGPQQPQLKHSSSKTWLVAAAVVLGAIAVGLVTWALVDFDDEASDPQLETATELVDTMHEGLNEDDVEKAASVFTADGVWLWQGSEVPVATGFENPTIMAISNWQRVSEVIELGEGVYTFVQEMGTDTRAVVVIEFDGDLLSQARWVSDFYEAPTD